jgi:hypothetical protein
VLSRLLSDPANSWEVKSESQGANNMKTKIVDYLAEELKQAEKREAKHERMAKLVVSLKAKGAAAGR